MKIEVCINRLEDISLLQSMAIDRIELCVELGCGGLTPPFSMIDKALTLSHVPIHVLVRPRSGDFIYSEETLELMLQDCLAIEALGVAGIVTGALTPEGTLSLTFLEHLRSNLYRCALYFHRAFDDVIQPEYALEQLMALGFDGVLTSGQRTTALEGIDKLTQWKQMADGKLVVMPGSGINAANFQHFQEAGFKWIHLSSKKIMPMTSSSSSSSSLFSAPQYGIDIIALNKLIERVKSNQ